MTLGHFIFIPGILLLGVVIGWVLATRSAETARQDRKERDGRRAARQARPGAD